MATTLTISETGAVLTIATGFDAKLVRGVLWTETDPTDGQVPQYNASGLVIDWVDPDSLITGGFVDVTGDTMTGALIMQATLQIEDDKQLQFGTGTDYWMEYDATGTQFRLRTTDADGAGADGTIFSVQDGVDDVVFVGDITAVNLTGTLQTAAQPNITSLGTLVSLQVDNLNLDGNTLSSTAGVDLLITPLAGQQIVLDGAIVIDAGVVTGATSITSTAFVGALTGNASTATALATPRNIGGVAFDGTGDIVPQTVQVVDSTDATSFVAMFDSATGNLQPKTDAGLSYDATTGTLTATAFSGPLTGAVTGNADSATVLATPRTIGGVSFDGSANIVPNTITVADTADATSFVGLWESATGDLAPKTDAALTYDATSGILTASGFAGPLTGNASTATALETPRTIGAVSFDGSASIVPQTIQVVDSTDASSSIAMFDSATGNLQPKTDAGLTYNAATGVLTATGFAGPLTGAVTGNADTATVLQTPRDINGVSFDGSANITITAAAGTLTGTTLNSTVVSSSLTSLGTIGSLVATEADIATLSRAGDQTIDLTGAATRTLTLQNSTASQVANLDADGVYVWRAGHATGTYTFAGTPTVARTLTWPDASITINAAADISGTTLASGVVTSSLTTIGTLVGGAVPANFVTAATFAAGTFSFAGSAISDLGSVTTADINGGTIGGVTLDGTISGTPTWASNQAIVLSTASQPNITALGTIISLVATSADINGGTIDGAVIGGAVEAAGSFTTLGASGTTELGGVLLVKNADPQMRLHDLDGAVDQRKIRVRLVSDSIDFELRNDAEGFVRNLLQLAVSGAVTVPGTFAVTGVATLATVNMSGALTLTSTLPQLIFIESDSGADNKRWDSIAIAEQLFMRVVDDAGSVASNWIEVQRSTTTVDSVTFPGSALISTGLFTATAGVKFGTTVTLTEGTANRLDLASGDSLYLVSGGLGVGVAHTVAGQAKFNSSVICASAALGTTATDGFLYVPTSAGVPTGVPTTQTGTVALEYDTSNNDLYVYNGAWKKVALA